jgi:hypothetical protein
MRSQLHFLKFISVIALIQTAIACSQQKLGSEPSSQKAVISASTAQPALSPAPSNQQTTTKAEIIPQPQISVGTYNLGSRYIQIVNLGNRFCYEGVSLPSGRYDVAVGETTGSLSPEKDYFAIDGWKKYGKTITLRQNGSNLLITDNSGSSQEYSFLNNNTSKVGFSEPLLKCLNSTEPFFETQPGYTISSATTTPPNQSTGNLLSPEQKTQLMRLPLTIIAPTSLPAGFRLVKASGEVGKYANGDDDSGYAIAYEGEANTCITITGTQSGTRGLNKLREEQTEFGLLTIYTENARDNTIRTIVTPLGVNGSVKGNLILISGGTLPDNTTSQGWKPCSPVSIPTYIEVLKSLSVVK